MNVRLIVSVVLVCWYSQLTAQVFQQSFNQGGAIGAYVNLSNPNANQFNVISNYPNFSRSFKDEKLVFKKNGSSSVNIARTTDIESNESIKAIQVSFKFRVGGEQQGRSSIFTHGKFLLGEGFDPTSTAYPDEEFVNSSLVFNFPNSKEGGQFQGFKIGGKSNANLVFSGEQIISLVVNVSGKSIQYQSPVGEKETLVHGKYDVWVGTTKVLAGVAVQNPGVTIKNFKLLIVPQSPDGLELSFDDFVISKLD